MKQYTIIHPRETLARRRQNQVVVNFVRTRCAYKMHLDSWAIMVPKRTKPHMRLEENPKCFHVLENVYKCLLQYLYIADSRTPCEAVKRPTSSDIVS